MIKIVNVSKKYKNKDLFDNINVEFSSGKKIEIRGTNGCGKSVLLKMVVGYSKPNKGYIEVDGAVIGKEMDFINNAGVSINAPEFVMNMSGMQNLLELAAIRKVASEDSIIELAKRLDFEKDIYKKYKLYSLGMKQKMRIIQALMDLPKYLILDEPFDALDKQSKCNVIDLLNEFMQQDKQNYLIYASHDQSLVNFADIVYEIDEMKLIELIS